MKIYKKSNNVNILYFFCKLEGGRVKKLYLLIVNIFIVINVNCKNIKEDINTNNDNIRKTVKSTLQQNKKINHLNDNFIVIAHRGIGFGYPENTLEEFKVAAKNGVKFVECDVRLTKDKQWVIMHDETLERTTTAIGKVADKTLKYIKNNSIKNGKQVTAYKVPTLEEFINFCKNNDVYPLIDFKLENVSDQDFDSFFNIIKNNNLEDKVIIGAHSSKIINLIRKKSSLVKLGCLFNINQKNLEYIQSIGNAFIYTNYEQYNDKNIKLCKENNVKMGAWTVNKREYFQRLKDQGIFLICTNEINSKISQ